MRHVFLITTLFIFSASCKTGSDGSASSTKADANPIAVSPSFTNNGDGSITAPGGAVWYHSMQKDNGAIGAHLNHDDAITCCNGPARAGLFASCPFGKGGAHLPSKEEFQSLAAQLGYGSTGGYNSAPIKTLAVDFLFHSSSTFQDPGNPDIQEWTFDGLSGDLFSSDPAYHEAVICTSTRSADLPTRK